MLYNNYNIENAGKQYHDEPVKHVFENLAGHRGKSSTQSISQFPKVFPKGIYLDHTNSELGKPRVPRIKITKRI